MSITIVATPGAADANSHVTADEMTAYCDARLNASVWTAADDQLPALVEATRDLTTLAYVGDRGSATQALAWPRVWAPNPDAPTILVDPTLYIQVGSAQLIYYGETEIPRRVKDATCELALQYLKAGATDLAALDPKIGVLQKTVGPLSTTYAEPEKRAQGLARFPRVMALLAPLLAPSAGSGLTVVRT